MLPWPSDGGVCDGAVLRAAARHFGVGRGREQEAAGAHLPAGPAEVLGHEGVEDRVHAGISVRQTVGDDAEDEGGVVEGESSELHPHGDDVMRHPADGEGSDQQEHGLSGLQIKQGQGASTRPGSHTFSFLRAVYWCKAGL